MCWGLWAGFGAIQLSRLLKPPLNMIAIVLPFAPVILNWTAVDRRRDEVEAQARIDSGEMLSKVPPNGVMLALGDNDTYPLWYLQQVESTRRDVTIVTVPLLGAKWYRAELARRYKLLDSTAVENWVGRDSTVALLTKRSYAQNRPVVKSPFFSIDSPARAK
jgi:hypothetical protein